MPNMIPSDPWGIDATADHGNMPSVAVNTTCNRKCVCLCKIEGSHGGDKHRTSGD
jgi:hypothetical protein